MSLNLRAINFISNIKYTKENIQGKCRIKLVSMRIIFLTWMWKDLLENEKKNTIKQIDFIDWILKEYQCYFITDTRDKNSSTFTVVFPNWSCLHGFLHVNISKSGCLLLKIKSAIFAPGESYFFFIRNTKSTTHMECIGYLYCFEYIIFTVTERQKWIKETS